MQNLKTLTLLSLIVIFFSCSDNSKETDYRANLAGKWTYKSGSFDITVNGQDFIDYYVNVVGITSEQASQAEDALKQANSALALEGVSLNFKSGGTYEATSGGSSYSGTWSINTAGTKLTFDPGSSDAGVFDVNTLTDSNLSISFSQEDSSSDLNGDGTNDTLKIGFTINMTK